MPIGKVEFVVRRFVSDNSNDLLVLKGGWGVGKTYFWHSAVKEASAKKAIGRSSYAYVSLFGLNSLDDLRNAIFAARVQSPDIGKKDPLSVLEGNAKGLVQYMKSLPKLKEWSAVASAAAFHMVSDTLICLDDLERKGGGLDTKEILGLVSLLKEQRNCKIAIILNDGSLQTDERENFQKHGEKLVDMELRFSQTPEEAFKCAFPRKALHYEEMAKHCPKLGITNIRVLQRLRRFVDGLSDWYPKCENGVDDYILQTLALYVWCYYDKDGNAPPLEFVRRYGFNPFSSLKGKEEETPPQEKIWSDLLREYGYTHTDDLGLQIAEYVQKGYVDDEALDPVLEKKNAEVRSTKGQEHYRRAWDLYHNTFDNNEGEFVGELIESFRANMKYLSPMNLSGVSETLREFGRDKEADGLIEEYIASRAENPKVFDLDTYSFRGDIRDPQVIRRFEETLAGCEETRTLREVLQRLVSTSGWGVGDEAFLASCSAEDYYALFKEERSEDLHHYVARCLQFGSYGNATECQLSIADKAREALRKIGSECAINKMRIEKTYGVKLDSAVVTPKE